MPQTYDVIVVGGGPGGSACAALLQKQGMKTLLLEQNDTVGGKAMRRSKDGFTYDLWPLIGMPKYGTKFEEVLAGLGAEVLCTAHRKRRNTYLSCCFPLDIRKY